MEVAKATTSRGDASKLIEQVEQARRLDLSRYRPSYLERRLDTRLRALGLTTYREYTAHLSRHPEEYDRLLDAVTVNVTDFFRDESTWNALRDEVVPALLAAKAAARHRLIRAWSAGCATGQEAYSLAMVLDWAASRHAGRCAFSVLGTDLDPRALATAREGAYDSAEARHIPEQYRTRSTDESDGRVAIAPHLREHVRFQPLDLFVDQPPLAMDLITCRNVFIYFKREEQSELVGLFHRALVRGGYLVLGKTERLPSSASALFAPVTVVERIYRKV